MDKVSKKDEKMAPKDIVAFSMWVGTILIRRVDNTCFFVSFFINFILAL